MSGYQKRKERVVKGVLESTLSNLTTSTSGKDWIRFHLRSGNEQYAVTAFEKYARFVSTLETGSLIKCWGTDEKDSVDEEERRKFLASTVAFYSPEDDREKMARDYAIQLHGSLEKFYQARKAQDESLIGQGMARVKFEGGSLGWVPKAYSDGQGRLLVDRLIEAGGEEFTDYVRKHFTTDSPRAWLPFLYSECQKRGIATPYLDTTGGGMEKRDRTDSRTQTEGKERQDSMDKDRSQSLGMAQGVDDTAALLAQIEGEL